MRAALALLVMTSGQTPPPPAPRGRAPPPPPAAPAPAPAPAPAAARYWAFLLLLTVRAHRPRPRPHPRPPSPVLVGLRKVLGGRVSRPRPRPLRQLAPDSAPGRPNAPLAAAAAGLLPPKEEKPSLLSLPPGANGGANPSVPGAGLPDPAASLQPAITSGTPLSSGDPLPREATAAQAARWLEAQRFTAHLRTFGSFSGADLLRLTRDDLVQLCGLADGIRLHNALHAKSIAPSLTLYLCVEEQSPVYRALYLNSLSYAEFVGKLANLVGVPVSQLSDVLLQGPAGIHVLLTDDVIRNVRNETRFMLEVLPDPNHDQYRLLLKPTQ